MVGAEGKAVLVLFGTWPTVQLKRRRVNIDQVILRYLRVQTVMMASATLKMVLIPGEERIWYINLIVRASRQLPHASSVPSKNSRSQTASTVSQQGRKVNRHMNHGVTYSRG